MPHTTLKTKYTRNSGNLKKIQMYTCKVYSDYILHTENVFCVDSFKDLLLHKARSSQIFSQKLNKIIIKKI